MDTIRYMLGYIVKIVLALAIIIIVWWFVALLYPNASFRSLFREGLFSVDWLPSPKQYGFLSARAPTDGLYGKEYVPGPEFNGYGNLYRYSTGTISQGGGTYTVSYRERSTYLRNMSIFDGSPISYGETITGQTRNEMFRNGIFPVLIIDERGRVVASAYAMRVDTWSPLGWSGFSFTVPSRLPRGGCTVVFVSPAGLRLPVPVRCS